MSGVKKDLDVFISHADEDKVEIAEPLANLLIKKGISVFYDRISIRGGESILTRMKEGLIHCKLALFIISHNFFKSKLTNIELETMQMRGEEKMLFVWHNITSKEVEFYNPIIRRLVAWRTNEYTVEEIVEEIMERLNSLNKEYSTPPKSAEIDKLFEGIEDFSDDEENSPTFIPVEPAYEIDDLKYKNENFIERKERPSIPKTYIDLGSFYIDQENYDKALEYYLMTLDYNSVLYKSYPHRASDNYRSIAFVYHKKSNYSEALEWYYKALEIQKKCIGGKKGPSAADIYNDLAAVYNSQGNFSKALDLSLKAYKMMIKKLSERHPSAERIKKSIEVFYKDSGLREPFEEWLKRNME